MGGPRNSLNMNCIFFFKEKLSRIVAYKLISKFYLGKKRLTIKKGKVWLKITRLVSQLAGQP